MMMRLYFAIRLFQIVVPAIRKAMVGAFKFLLTPMLTLWVGVPQGTDAIAREWVEKARQAGLPTYPWDRRLYYAIRVIAFFTILLGWVFMSFVTVWIVRLIFR